MPAKRHPRPKDGSLQHVSRDSAFAYTLLDEPLWFATGIRLPLFALRRDSRHRFDHVRQGSRLRFDRRSA